MEGKSVDDLVAVACPEADELTAWAELRDRSTGTNTIREHVSRCPECAESIAMLGHRDVSVFGRCAPVGRRYALQTVLDHGGQGVICVAQDLVLRRRVAIKLIRDDNGRAARLLEEAVSQASFSHPNVLSVLDVGRDGGDLFVVLEFVEGTDLATASLAPTFGRAEVRRAVLDAALGLAALHRAGITHGDVTPRNLLLDSCGRTRIIDFGLAAPDRKARGGTIGFSAPETSGGVATPKSDQYGLGATLLVLLQSSSRPCVATQRVARRACAADPARRYDTIEQFARALSQARVRSGLMVAVVAALAVLVSPAAPPDLAANAMSALETAGRAEMAAGNKGRAREFVRRAHELAEREGRPELVARVALLDSALGGHNGFANVKKALLSARASGSPGLEAEALMLMATESQAAQMQDVLVQMSLDALEQTDEDDPVREYVALSMAVATMDDETATLPARDGVYADFIDMIAVAQTIGEDEAPIPEVDCRGLDGALVQGYCHAILGAAALDKDNARALREANRSLSLLEGRGEPWDRSFALSVRGVVYMREHRYEEAQVDLASATALVDPDDDLADVLLVRVLWAQSLVHVGRVEQAAAIAKEAAAHLRAPGFSDEEVEEALAELDALLMTTGESMTK